MTIDEAKKLLPAELKYPLPIEVIDNLLGIQRIAIDMSEPDEKGMYYAMLAALIELKERMNCGANNSNARKDFMDIVYDELSDDEDNLRANRIIDAADAYADSFDDIYERKERDSDGR